MNYYRFTLFEDGFNLARDLGLELDHNSKPEIFEWYLTFEDPNDSVSFQKLLMEKNVEHGFSFWGSVDPRKI